MTFKLVAALGIFGRKVQGSDRGNLSAADGGQHFHQRFMLPSLQSDHFVPRFAEQNARKEEEWKEEGPGGLAKGFSPLRVHPGGLGVGRRRKKKKIFSSDQNGAVFQLFRIFSLTEESSSVFSPKFSFPRGEGVLFSCELGTFLVPTLEY